MSVPIYYVDAFTDKLFSGNPAAVIFSDINNENLMQKIAAENNLSETAFIRNHNENYHIRWFAPLCEIDLCGHATLSPLSSQNSTPPLSDNCWAKSELLLSLLDQ